MNASTDVTASLRRTHDLISSELSRSAFARQTLAESTAALGSLQETYSGLDGMLASSRDLVGSLLRTQKSDSWYLETAMYLLLGTLGWLVFRRWLYGPLWWLVWLPLKMIWRTGKGVGGVVTGIGGGDGAEMEVAGGGVEGWGGRRVVGMDDEGVVPTVRVGEENRDKAGGGGDPDLMVEKIGRIVDGQEEDATAGHEEDGSRQPLTERSNDNPPNPKKRMWEENDGMNIAEEAKDEL